MAFFNIAFAWGATVLSAPLLLIYALRRMPRSWRRVQQTNRVLSGMHIVLAKLSIAFGLAHGALSSANLLHPNWGSGLWLIMIGLAATFYVKTHLPRGTWKVLHRILSVFFLIVLALHLWEVGLVARPQGNSTLRVIEGVESVGSSEEEVSQSYVPGVYEIVVDGYRPGLVVEVELSAERIERIEIVSHNELRASIYGPAMERVPADILEMQSVQVDGVSGATCTSNGIKQAVAGVLETASHE